MSNSDHAYRAKQTRQKKKNIIKATATIGLSIGTGIIISRALRASVKKAVDYTDLFTKETHDGYYDYEQFLEDKKNGNN